MIETLGLFLLLRILFGGGGFRMPPAGAQDPAVPAPGADPAPPAPWPIAAPSSLPPWPSGWEYDEPPPPEVVRRAQQLLSPLWKRGQGATQVDNVNGRWITFKAEVVRGGLKGVTAWRPRRGASPGPDVNVSPVDPAIASASRTKARAPTARA